MVNCIIEQMPIRSDDDLSTLKDPDNKYVRSICQPSDKSATGQLRSVAVTLQLADDSLQHRAIQNEIPNTKNGDIYVAKEYFTSFFLFFQHIFFHKSI